MSENEGVIKVTRTKGAGFQEDKYGNEHSFSTTESSQGPGPAIHLLLHLGGIIWLLKETCSCKLYFVTRNEGTDAAVRLLVFKHCIYHLQVV